MQQHIKLPHNRFQYTVLKTVPNQTILVPPVLKGALVYGFLQGFTSLKARYITGLDLNGFACSRSASHACSTSLDRECSKADQRY